MRSHLIPVSRVSSSPFRLDDRFSIQMRNAARAILMCFLGTGFAPVFGTTVFAFVTPTQVTIGADSRENDGARPLPAPVCKILTPDGNRFWAAANVYKEKLAGFNIEDVVRNASSNTRSMKEWATAFEQLILPELRRTIQNVRLKDSASYKKTYRGAHVVEIIFTGYENNVPLLFYRDYKTDANGVLIKPSTAARTSIDCPGPDCKPGMYFCIGDCAEIKRLSDQDRTLFRDLSAITTTTRWMIRVEIGAHWQVGTPVDVLQFDAKGPRWVDKEPQSKCEPIRVR